MTFVTFRPSRACVQSACNVYIAPPSPCSASTGRSGQATAAPVASGSPMPMPPPVRYIDVCRRAVCVRKKAGPPEVADSSAMIAFSGSAAVIAAPTDFEVNAPFGGSGSFNSMSSEPVFGASRLAESASR